MLPISSHSGSLSSTRKFSEHKVYITATMFIKFSNGPRNQGAFCPVHSRSLQRPRLPHPNLSANSIAVSSISSVSNCEQSFAAARFRAWRPRGDVTAEWYGREDRELRTTSFLSGRSICRKLRAWHDLRRVYRLRRLVRCAAWPAFVDGVCRRRSTFHNRSFKFLMHVLETKKTAAGSS